MKLLTTAEIMETLKWSRPTLNAKIKRGEFIQPVQIGERLMFIEEELHEWVADKRRGLFRLHEGLRRHQEAKRKGKVRQ